MTNRTLEMSPQTLARIGGVIYLVIIVSGIFGELFVRDALFVSGDAATTASHIMGSELRWRIGIAGDLFMHVCDVPLMLVYYILFKPVNRHLTLLAILFNVVQTAVLVATKMNLFMPLFLLGGAPYLGAFEPAQLQAFSYLSLKMDNYGFGVGLIFFGFECLVLGYLIFRSGFLPRFLGVFMEIVGICYLVNSFALILSPAFAGAISPAILVPCFIGESSLCLWLIVKGVDPKRWNERAALAAQS